MGTFPMRRYATILWGLLLCTPLLGQQSRTVEKKDDHYAFKFHWDGNSIWFDIPAETITRDSHWDKEELRKNVHPTEALIDYPKLAREATEGLKEVSNALKATAIDKTPRGLAQHALLFVQTIPYSTKFKNKTGFQPPTMVLFDNKGDCDSKTTLLAAILNNWGIPWVTVHVPKHALIGIACGATDADHTVVHNGQTFVLAEPAGPAQFPIGQTAKSSVPKSKQVKTLETPEQADKAVLTQKLEYQKTLSKEIEKAKLEIVRFRMNQINTPAKASDLKFKLSTADYAKMMKAINSEEISSLGTYPDPRGGKLSQGVTWNKE